jgi:rubrerythrin
MNKSPPSPETAELKNLQTVFQNVASRHTGSVRQILLEAGENLVSPSDDEDKIETVAAVYSDAIDALEQEAETNPAAAAAMEEIGEAVQRSLRRMMGGPAF